jgi:segregation and condensation protein A
MTHPAADALDFAADLDAEEVLALDLDGFEGPLHLLLALARAGRIDLKALSMTALADQYLAFIAAAKMRRLEIAADYLVMAAWLAQLKSRLLLPAKEREPDEVLPPEEQARRLAFRLKRLDAMRQAGQDLQSGLVLGRDVFVRGAPEGLGVRASGAPGAELHDLLKAYATRRVAVARQRYTLPAPKVYALADARHRLLRNLPPDHDWRDLTSFLPSDDLFAEPPPRRSVLASAFAAGLELAKEGRAEIRQEAPFEPIYVRKREGTRVEDLPANDVAETPAPPKELGA